MNPYPEYKETNLPWLPRIPIHWEVRKIKHLFTERSEKGYPDEPLLAATQNHGVIPKSLYESRTVTAQKDLQLLKLVRVGDFVISLRSFQGGIEYAYYQGIISPAYTIMIPVAEQLSSDYFKYLAKSKPFVKLLQTCVTGIREGQNIDYETLKRDSIPLPSPSEQAQIVRYLDAMTAKINRLIRAKKKAIALLQEQKQAIINQAVTKGLNPNAEMKDSGIDWIGRVPKHWEIVPIKYCSEILPGFAFDSQKFVSHGKYFLLRGINVGIGKISHDNAVFWNDNIDESVNAFQLKKNDIVLGLDRPWIKNGLRIAKIEECDIPLLLVQRVCRIRAKESMENDFLLVAIQAVLREALETQTTGISVPHISTNQVGNVKIPFPPLEEQREILEDLLSRANTINKSITKILTEIDIVYELKNAYISQVVMGAVDVRSIVIEDFSHEDIDDDFDFSNKTENVEECEEYR